MYIKKTSETEIEVNDKFLGRIFEIIQEEFCEDDWQNEDGTLNIDGVIECFCQNVGYCMNTYLYGSGSIFPDVKYDLNIEEFKKEFKTYLTNK